MNTGSLDEWPVTLSGRVVDRKGDLRLMGDQRPDHLTEQASGDVLGLLASRRDRCVARSELAAEAGSPYPTGDGPPATGQNRAEKEPG